MMESMYRGKIDNIDETFHDIMKQSLSVWNDTSHKMDDIGLLYGCFEDTDDMWP